MNQFCTCLCVRHICCHKIHSAICVYDAVYCTRSYTTHLSDPIGTGEAMNTRHHKRWRRSVISKSSGGDHLYLSFKLIALQLGSQLAIFSVYSKAWSMHAVSTEQTVLLSSNCQLHVALFKYAEVVELFFCREDIWTVVYLTLRCLIYVFELPLFKHRGRLLDRGIESPLTQLYSWYSSP